MRKIITLLFLATVVVAAMAEDAFQGKVTNPYIGGQAALSDSVLSTKVIENIYLMPEQITKLIFPKAVDEVAVNSKMVNIGRNPAGSQEYYLLLSPLVTSGEINMHVVIGGQTYTFRLIIGKEFVNYRKTFTMQSRASHSIPRVPPLAPSEINTVNLITMINHARHEPNYSDAIASQMGVSPQGITYLWNGCEVTLLEAWHWYKQDVVVLRIEVHNPKSQAVYLSATQIQPYIANTRFDYLLTEQGTKVLMPGQTDVKYLFIQGYGLDIANARFELRMPPTGNQIKPQ